jgi:hypothetical protein
VEVPDDPIARAGPVRAELPLTHRSLGAHARRWEPR